MSLEGTKQSPNYSEKSCFSLVSGGDKGDSEKHCVGTEKKRFHTLCFESIDASLICPPQRDRLFEKVQTFSNVDCVANVILL